jgi:hypothetical protein
LTVVPSPVHVASQAYGVRRPTANILRRAP